jgi:hypothetical protein
MICRSIRLDAQIVVPSLATPSTSRCFGSIVATTCGWTAAAANANSAISAPLPQAICASWSGYRRWQRHIRGARTSCPTPIVGDEAARFLDQQDPGRRVPDVEIVFPETIKPASGDPRKVKRAAPKRRMPETCGAIAL